MSLCIRVLIGIFTLLLHVSLLANQVETAGNFRLHLVEEPGRLLPQYKERFTGQYLLGAIFDSYYKVNEDNELVPSMMKSCSWAGQVRLVCTPAERKWANGQRISAINYYNHLTRQLNKDSISSAKELFSELKNYKEYLAGEVPFEKVGIQLTESKKQLVFQLNSPDREFIYNLTHPVLSPLPTYVDEDRKLATEYATGPYKLKKWQLGRSILLERNPHYPVQVENPPTVEFFFIAEDYTSLNLYEKGQLDFLRRLSTQHKKKYESLGQLMVVNFFRMDYIGFGSSLKNFAETRKQLQHGYNPSEFLKVFSATGAPVGCMGIPLHLQSKKNCLIQKKVKSKEKTPRLRLYFSKQGGESMARSMEWFQSQWKKNSGLNVELVSEDVKVLGAQLRKKAPDMFRRGVPLSRPTCLAALEIFHSKSPDNFIGFHSSKYDLLIKQMRQPKTKTAQLKRLCTQGIQALLASGLLIPLGEVQYFMLNNKRFKGFSVNGLNQLDLSRLTAAQ